MLVLVGGREEVLQAPLARVLTVMGTDTVVKLKLMSYRVRVSSGNDGATAVRYRVMDVEG